MGKRNGHFCRCQQSIVPYYETQLSCPRMSTGIVIKCPLSTCLVLFRARSHVKADWYNAAVFELAACHQVAQQLCTAAIIKAVHHSSCMGWTYMLALTATGSLACSAAAATLAAHRMRTSSEAKCFVQTWLLHVSLIENACRATSYDCIKWHYYFPDRHTLTHCAIVTAPRFWYSLEF